jgi:integrase
VTTGIEQRHSTSCAAGRDPDKRCTCSPRVYRAWVSDPTSKRKRRSPPFTSHAAAAAWRAEALAALKTLAGRPKEQPKLRDAVADAIAGIEVGAIVTTRGTPFAPGSIRNLEADYRNHVAPFFANARLNEIDRGALQRWIRGLSSGSFPHLTRPLSPSAVANCLKPLRLVYRVQRENDASFSEDPFAGLQLPREHAKRERAMPISEFSKRIDALPDDELRLIYGLAGYAGLRLGEIQSLTAERVGACAIEVVTGYDAYAGVRARPKTPAGQRVVPIIPPLRRLLDAHLASSGITHGLLFPSRAQPGRALDKRAIHRRAQRAFSVVGFDFVRPHDARHCFGTYMGFAGVPSHTLRLVIGHSSIKATERYLHRLEEAALEAGSALSRYAAKQLDEVQQEASQDDLADLSRAELVRLIGDLRRQLAVTSASSRSA